MKKAIYILVIVLTLGLKYTSLSFAFTFQSPVLPLPDQLKYRPLQFKLPLAQKKVLSNGINLYIVEDHELPLIKITVLMKVGQADDPLGKEGLAELTSTVMVTGGTRLMSGNEVDESLAFMAADIRSTVNLEYTLFTLSVLKKDLDGALNIFSQILREPLFERGKLQTARDLKVEELRRIADNPADLSFRQYRRLLYRNNPRGRLSTFASLNKIDRQDLVKFHESFFSGKNVMMTVSGDISGDEALAKLNRHLGTWRKGDFHRKSLSPPVSNQTFSLSLLSKETPQSIIIYGHLVPAVTDPDFYPFTVLDFILGSGGFRSRMFQEIRTKRGLAYSSGSIYVGRRDYGVFESYVFTKAGSTAQVLTIMKDIIKKMQDEEIDLEELQWAKNAIQNNFIFSFKTADDVAFQHMMLEYQKLPSNFLETYREKIEAVKAEDLKRMASKYLNLQKATVLVVGPEKEFDSPLSIFGTVNREDIFD